MTADEFRAELKELGIKQRWLANTLGVSANTVNRWVTGEIPVVPQYALAYLSLLRRVREAASNLWELLPR